MNESLSLELSSDAIDNIIQKVKDINVQNVEITKKKIRVLDGDTRCILRGKITLPKDLVEFISKLPEFKKFVKDQENKIMITWNNDSIEVMGVGHGHQTNADNQKVKEQEATTKAQSHMSKGIENFQNNLQKFITKFLESDKKAKSL